MGASVMFGFGLIVGAAWFGLWSGVWMRIGRGTLRLCLLGNMILWMTAMMSKDPPSFPLSIFTFYFLS